MLIIYVVAFIAIFYFMAIRPQQRQRRAHQALLSALKKGDRIVTAAGIYGTVKRVEESIVVVEVAKGVTLKIARRAVAEIIRDSSMARATAPETAPRRGSNAVAEIEDSTSADVDAEVDSEEDESLTADMPEETSSKPASKSSRRGRR